MSRVMTEEHKAALRAGRERAKQRRMEGVEEDEEEAGGERTPLQAIRAYCLECCETSAEVEKCHVPRCPLWPMRFGKRVSTAQAEGRLVDPGKFRCTCGLKGQVCDGRG